MDDIRILIVDDHQIVLKGLRQLVLETLGQDTVIDTALSVAEIKSCLDRNSYTLCILDIELPGFKDLDLLHRLRRDHPDMKIIINTIHEQIWYVKEFMAADVEGILFKNNDVREISTAIRTVIDDGRYYCRSARVLKNDLPNHTYPTHREIQVLKALAEGYTTEEISRLLKISIYTTESHRRHLLEKLDARNVAELIMKATRHGIIT